MLEEHASIFAARQLATEAAATAATDDGSAPSEAAPTKAKKLLDVDVSKAEGASKVSKTTVPRVLASKLYYMFDGNKDNAAFEVRLSAIGAIACFNAIRGIAIANEERARIGQPPLGLSMEQLGSKATAFLMTLKPSTDLSHVTKDIPEARNLMMTKQSKSARLATLACDWIRSDETPIRISAVGCTAVTRTLFTMGLINQFMLKDGIPITASVFRELGEPVDNAARLSILRFTVKRTGPVPEHVIAAQAERKAAREARAAEAANAAPAAEAAAPADEGAQGEAAAATAAAVAAPKKAKQASSKGKGSSTPASTANGNSNKEGGKRLAKGPTPNKKPAAETDARA